MKESKFEEIWMNQVSLEKSMLLERAEAYATKGDRLGNFYEGARLIGQNQMMYAFNLVTKHIIALRDLIDKINGGEAKFTDKEEAKLTEYVTDIRNYAVLIKALYSEMKEDFQ